MSRFWRPRIAVVLAVPAYGMGLRLGAWPIHFARLRLMAIVGPVGHCQSASPAIARNFARPEDSSLPQGRLETPGILSRGLRFPGLHNPLVRLHGHCLDHRRLLP